MRSSKVRWYAPLLEHPESTAFYVHKLFPKAKFTIKKDEIGGKLIRHFEMYVGKDIILRGRSEVDMKRTHPKLVSLLVTTDTPLGILIKDFNVRRTRVRSTSRSREYHFTGDLHAMLRERFFLLPKED